MKTYIETNDFSQNVAELCKGFGFDIHPGQIQEALSAITNLYHDCMIQYDVHTLNITTDHTLSSRHVSSQEILKAIEYATGFDRTDSSAIQEIIELCISNLFKEFLVDNFQNTLYVKPLGKFQLKKNEIIPEVLMTYEDPNKEYLAEFLF